MFDMNVRVYHTLINFITSLDFKNCINYINYFDIIPCMYI